MLYVTKSELLSCRTITLKSDKTLKKKRTELRIEKWCRSSTRFYVWNEKKGKEGRYSWWVCDSENTSEVPNNVKSLSVSTNDDLTNQRVTYSILYVHKMTIWIIFFLSFLFLETIVCNHLKDTRMLKRWSISIKIEPIIKL